MDYLVFDIECCDGKHICEFGYTLFDQDFNIIKQDCLTINPEFPFRLSPKGKQSTITLAFTEEQYYNSPKFTAYYEQIKELIEMPERQIIGFASQSDKKFLATACANYNLPAIKYESLDFQKLYKIYTGAPNVTSVEKMLGELEIDGITLHKSDEDALAVMLSLQAICTKEKLNVCQTLEMLKAKSNAYQIERAKAKKKANYEKFLKKKSLEPTVGEIIADKRKREIGANNSRN